jgi:hypothetical protein
MAGRRKLFLTHAGELAHLLVSAIARDAMAMEFVRGYALRNDRQKVLANAERLREMESMISRESLLLIAAEVRRLLPGAFRLSANSHSEDRALCELFYVEFLEALGRAMNWPVAEGDPGAQDFHRDLEMYATWRERNALLRARTKSPGDESPFPDRCAILLDSAMMEQARRDAAKFQAELLRLGRRMFGQLGSPAKRRVSTGREGGRSGKRSRNAQRATKMKMRNYTREGGQAKKRHRNRRQR